MHILSNKSGANHESHTKQDVGTSDQCRECFLSDGEHQDRAGDPYFTIFRIRWLLESEM